MGISCRRKYHRQAPGLGSPHLWIIVTLFAVLILFHLTQLLNQIPVPSSASLHTAMGLSWDSLERLLYLLLVLYAGWTLGVIGGGALWLSSAIAMLLRTFLISPNAADALWEISASLVIGALAIALMKVYRQNKRRQEKLEAAMKNLELSRQNYEELFTNASDAIWIHDMEGNITLANKACEKLTGYSVPELIGKNVRVFLAPKALTLAGQVKDRLLKGEAMEERYEQQLTRKDGSEAIMQLATRLIFSDAKPLAFQHMARDITEERKLRDNMKFYLKEYLKAQEEERKRLACELHDDTSQQILLLAHSLDNLASKASNSLSPELRNELEKLYELTQQTHRGIRRYAQALRPSILDDLGLVPALEWLARQLTNLTGIKVQVKTLPIPPLPQEIQLILFRIAQEALNNIYRHSGASEASVTLETQEDQVRMTINDNGKGFKVPKQLSDFASQGKLGLTGMVERIQLIGGKLEVTSQTGKGTQVVAKTPSKLNGGGNS